MAKGKTGTSGVWWVAGAKFGGNSILIWKKIADYKVKNITSIWPNLACTSRRGTPWDHLSESFESYGSAHLWYWDLFASEGGALLHYRRAPKRKTMRLSAEQWTFLWVHSLYDSNFLPMENEIKPDAIRYWSMKFEEGKEYRLTAFFFVLVLELHYGESSSLPQRRSRKIHIPGSYKQFP